LKADLRQTFKKYTYTCHTKIILIRFWVKVIGGRLGFFSR